jgi:hypothetical protein
VILDHSVIQYHREAP